MTYYTCNGEGKYTARQVAKLHHSKTFVSVDYRDEAKLLEVAEIAIYVAPIPKPQTEEQIIDGITAAVQMHLNAVAHSQRNYDSVDSAVKYIGGPNALWSAEGTALRDWTVAVWEYCYQVLADVKANKRTLPTSEELIAELPVIVWP